MKLYSTKDFASLTGVSIRTLKRWRKSGKLVPQTIKGDKFYSEEQLAGVTKYLRVTNFDVKVTNSKVVTPEGVITPAKFGKNNTVFYSEKQLQNLLKIPYSNAVKTNLTNSQSGDKFSDNLASGDKNISSGDTTGKIIIMTDKDSKEKFQILPAIIRHEPNDLLTEKIFYCNDGTYRQILAEGGSITEKTTKKYGKIKTDFWLELIDGYTDDKPLTQFDRAVLACCISEQLEGNKGTTPDIIFRSLTGKVGKKDSGIENKEQRAAILKSIDKLMCTQIKIDMSETCQKMNYNGRKPFKVTAPLLPCCYVETEINGQEVTAIKFYDESPILQAARIKRQIITYENKLLDIPKQNNTPKVIELKNYVMQRVTEIKSHKMTPTITFENVFEKCGILQGNTSKAKKQRHDARKNIVKLMKHLQEQGEISAFEVVKKCGKYHSIEFQFGEKKTIKK